MKDLGPLHCFLGIAVARQPGGGFFLSERTYAEDLLARANMTTCKPVSTPVDTHSNLSAIDGAQSPMPRSTTASSAPYST